jgi:hypothetical protein
LRPDTRAVQAQVLFELAGRHAAPAHMRCPAAVLACRVREVIGDRPQLASLLPEQPRVGGGV